MTTRIIRLCYRKVIDASSQDTWDRLVFESTYNEFLMQVQLYDPEGKYNSFGGLVQQVPGAEKLHFLVSTAVIGYLRQLKGIIPGILNNLGKHFLYFSDYRFEIINSDTRHKSKHQVAINFFSQPLCWHDTVGDQLLVSVQDDATSDEGRLTNLVKLHPFLSIYSLKEQR